MAKKETEQGVETPVEREVAVNTEAPQPQAGRNDYVDKRYPPAANAGT